MPVKHSIVPTVIKSTNSKEKINMVCNIASETAFVMKPINGSTKEQICQAYKTADEACTDILDIYEGMPACERRAFDIGEVYGKICSTRDKLENMRGAN